MASDCNESLMMKIQPARIALLIPVVLTFFAVCGCAETPLLDDSNAPGSTAVSQVAPVAVIGPQLTIVEPQFDFGFAPQGSKLTHSFWLKSTGDDTLRIIQIYPP